MPATFDPTFSNFSDCVLACERLTFGAGATKPREPSPDSSLPDRFARRLAFRCFRHKRDKVIGGAAGKLIM